MINPLSNPSYLLPPLVTLVVSLLLIAVVWRWGRKSLSTLLFSGFLLSIGLWALLLFGMRSSPDVYRALLWERALPVTGYATFVLYYHFTLAYTNTRGQRRILLAAYLYLAVVTALSPTELLIQRMRLEDYGYAPVMTPLAFPLMMSLPALMVGGAYNLVRRYKTSISYEERNRLLYLVIALLFPLLGTFLDAFSNLPPAGIWANLIFCIICSVAILKYHLLDIRIIIRKSLVYLLISAAVAIPYVSVLYSLYHFFESTVEAYWIHALIILLLAIILRPLYSLAQQFVDRLFYRDRYDYLRALEDFMQETHDVRNLNQLASSLVSLIGRALQSASVQLLLYSDLGDFISVPSTGDKKLQFRLGSNGPLLRRIRNKKSLLYRKDLAVTPQLQSLTKNEMDVLNKTEAKLIVPILTKEKELIGLIILGRKLSELEYSLEDERLILAVASRMAAELENARLYDLEKAMRKELEKQDEQKTEFLHSVAHELKTPLTAIVSSSELLSEDSSIPAELTTRLINNVRQSASSMERRVAELLNLARIQIGTLDIQPEPLEMDKTITEIVQQLQVIFENKEQVLKLEIPSSLPKVNGDRGKLEQVLFNLLSNANKFSPTGSEIVLRVRELEGRVVVEVEDLASPIAEVERSRLFDPYYRGEDTEKRERFPGLGLGLAVSKRIVELHQGKIWVENKPTKGNVFAFSLPAMDRRINRVK